MIQQTERKSQFYYVDMFKYELSGTYIFTYFNIFPIVALANGGILELPWMMVDPRRPINPEMREEGVIPYMPEIPVHMDAIINYNQSVSRVMGIHTSPSGLESTCLVFVHGLGEYSINIFDFRLSFL